MSSSSFTNQVGHSSVNLFEKIPILEPILWSNTQQHYPINTLNETSLEFQLETDRNVLIDLQQIFLHLRVKVRKGDGALEAADDTYMVNNSMHSLFSNCEVYLNNEQVFTANGLYAHNAFISNEFLGTRGTKESISICQGYSYETDPTALTDPNIQKRKVPVDDDLYYYYGKLAIDLFTCDKLMLPNVNIRIKLVRSRPQFYLLMPEQTADNLNVIIKEASLHVRHVAVDEGMLSSIQRNLLREPARYNYDEDLGKTFIIPSGQNQFIQENIFNNAPIRRLAWAMNLNTAFTGDRTLNPFHYRKFGLREIKIVRGNQVVYHVNYNNNSRAYITTMEALKYNDDGPAVAYDDYDNHFVNVCDLTSMQEANVQMYYPDVVASSLRIELYFNANLENTVELVIFGERLSTILINDTGAVTKNG